MPLRDYDLKTSFDADYRLTYRTPAPVALPAASVLFSGKTMTPTPGWPQVRVGGECRISLGKGNPLNIIGRVTDTTGGTITLDIPREWLTTTADVPEGGVIYVVPEIRVNYLSAVLRPGTYRVIDALVAALGIPAGATVAVIGCGMGWEVERLNELDFDAVGSEISAWVQSAKTTDESLDVDAALIAAGYDPAVGEGAVQRADMLAEPRSKVPDLVVDADVTNNSGRNAVKQKTKAKVKGGDSMDWAISIGVMQTLSDTEATALNDGMLALATNVAHYITVLPEVQNSPWNKKTAEEWKTLLSPALIVPHGIAREGYRVL